MPDTTEANTPSHSPRRPGTPRWALRLCLTLLVVLAVGGLVVHVTAVSAYSRSFDSSRSLEARADDAALAHTLERWNERYATRAIVMQKWLHGSILLKQGAYLPAMLELQDAYRMDVGDTELLALFKKSQAALNVNSNYKAHIQHAHEGPGGTLRPQDLVR